MGNTTEAARPDASRVLIPLRVTVPEKVMVRIANLGMHEHAWKEDFDISETYAELLRESLRIAEQLRMPRGDAADSGTDGSSMVRDVKYMYGGAEVLTTLNLPWDLVSAVEEIGKCDSTLPDDYAFSKALVSLIMESPRMQAWAISEIRRKDRPLPLVPRD